MKGYLLRTISCNLLFSRSVTRVYLVDTETRPKPEMILAYGFSGCYRETKFGGGEGTFVALLIDGNNGF